MSIILSLQYNPKIDYLVCKNLAKGLESGYDEERIRNVYLSRNQFVEKIHVFYKWFKVWRF